VDRIAATRCPGEGKLKLKLAAEKLGGGCIALKVVRPRLLLLLLDSIILSLYLSLQLPVYFSCTVRYGTYSFNTTSRIESLL
jgi:hypothetical protein